MWSHVFFGTRCSILVYELSLLMMMNVTSDKVDVDKSDKAPVEQAAAMEVYIHGWKIDDVMMGILAECFPAVTSLHTLDLWNVGLNDVTMAKLAGVVCTCRALRTLVLDANPVPTQRWHLFMQVVRACLSHQKVK